MYNENEIYNEVLIQSSTSIFMTRSYWTTTHFASLRHCCNTAIKIITIQKQKFDKQLDL